MERHGLKGTGHLLVVSLFGLSHLVNPVTVSEEQHSLQHRISLEHDYIKALSLTKPRL